MHVVAYVRRSHAPMELPKRVQVTVFPGPGGERWYRDGRSPIRDKARWEQFYTPEVLPAATTPEGVSLWLA